MTRVDEIYEHLGLDKNAVYNKTLVLLRLYRTLKWISAVRQNEFADELHIVNKEDLDLAVHTLGVFGSKEAKSRIFSELHCIKGNENLLFTIEQAALRVQNYPFNGEEYYKILQYAFLSERAYTESKILEELLMERSNYYSKRKQSVLLVGLILWNELQL